AGITVRLRDVDNGQIVATTRTNDRGEFKFAALPIGNFIVETVADDRATVLGTSPRIPLTAGAMTATGVTVSTSAAAAAAAGLPLRYVPGAPTLAADSFVRRRRLPVSSRSAPDQLPRRQGQRQSAVRSAERTAEASRGRHQQERLDRHLDLHGRDPHRPHRD